MVSKNAQNNKPFPMPGTAWRWLGNEQSPRPTGPHVVASLRWFRDRVEVLFEEGESCAGVEHLMQVDAWEFVPPEPNDLTPSEVALAKILAAWEEWPGRGDRADPEVLAMVGVHEALWTNRFISPGAITDAGRALLDRARKAGVL